MVIELLVRRQDRNIAKVTQKVKKDARRLAGGRATDPLNTAFEYASVKGQKIKKC